MSKFDQTESTNLFYTEIFTNETNLNPPNPSCVDRIGAKP